MLNLKLRTLTNTLICVRNHVLQERQAAKRAAKREKAKRVRARMARAKRQVEAEEKRKEKAKKRRIFAQRVRGVVVIKIVSMPFFCWRRAGDVALALQTKLSIGSQFFVYFDLA